jgi:hypothetical protein
MKTKKLVSGMWALEVPQRNGVTRIELFNSYEEVQCYLSLKNRIINAFKNLLR